MRWDERQVAMLEAMGIRLWAPALPVEVVDAASGEGGEGARASSAAAASAVVARPAARVVAPAESRVRARSPAPVAGSAAPEATAPSSAPSGLAWVRPAVPAVPTVRPTGEWATLAADAAACTACGLCAGRTRSVFASGGPPADWLVVGEPPVEAEDRDGVPFAGKPGQLLDNMLRAVGVSRADESGDRPVDAARRACLTLPVKCRPPGNRAPTTDELRTCESRHLVRQIELVRPKLILALGRAAALLLGSDEPLGKLRGRVHRYRDLPLIASYHPGYLLRNPADKARAWEDLCLAMETLRGEPT